MSFSAFVSLLLFVAVSCWTQAGVNAVPASCESECPVYIQAPPPVCGDGKEYMDECRAKCAGAKVITPGPCPSASCESGCPVYVRAPPPVCGDGKEYMDVCRAKCAGAKVIKPGPCCRPCAVRCADTYDPVCADGVTYRNRCMTICLCPKPKSVVPGECRKGR